MILFLLLIILCINLSTLEGICVCPVNEIISIQSIETEIKKQLSNIDNKILYNKTPSGFVISINNDLIFDSNECLNNTGKTILTILSKTIKSSGRRWLILAHSNKEKDNEKNLFKTSIYANIISSYLIEIEKCLINQIFPIGFGTIMPNKFVTSDFHEMHNRIDFVVEDFSLN